MPDFNQVITESESKKHVPKDLQGLQSFEEYAPMAGSPSGSSKLTPERQRKDGPLSLEEKRRIAAEQEQNLRMRSQPNLTPTSVVAKKTPTTNSSVNLNSVLPPTPFNNTNLTSSSFTQRMEQKPIDLTSLLISPPQPSNPVHRPAFGTPQSNFNPNMANFGSGGRLSPMNSSWNGPPVTGGASGTGVKMQQHNFNSPKQHNLDLSAFDNLVSFGESKVGNSKNRQ